MQKSQIKHLEEMMTKKEQEDQKPEFAPSFISYAQNYEDVMLYRALKGVEKGFYIDVGAMDPVYDSVTKAFYERGWRGINIEPVRKWYDKLVTDRPEDINLNVAISDEPGNLHLFDIPETGLSTFDKDLAENHLITQGFQSQEIIVPSMTLDAILKKAHYQEIHFLKIDVEGAEKQVLESINLKLLRPWIILVEATKPGSQIQDYKDWEHLLTGADYNFVYFDGLNRFYVPKEREDLALAFNTPPNVFDGFIRADEWNALLAAKAIETDRQQMEVALNSKEADRQQMVATLNTMEADRQKSEAELKARDVDRQQLGAALKAGEVKRQKLEAALNTMEAERQKSEAELKARDVDRQQLEAALKAGEIKRQQLEAVLNAEEADRQQLEAARNAINTELEVVKKNRDEVLGELGRVYRSRSFRITTPLRIIFGTLRKWRNQLKRGRDRSTPVGSNSPQNKKSSVRQFVDGLRKVAWIAILLDKFKQRFPRAWYGTARQIKKRFPLQPESITPYQPVALDQITLENDKHFLDLFQRELSRRQAKRTETKS